MSASQIRKLIGRKQSEILKMIKAKPKKCKICKSEFMPSNSMIKHCSPECGYKIHTANQDKKHKKEKIVYRLETKKVSVWRKEAQVAFNAYVRIRDHDKPCISSGKAAILGANEFDAGHYKSVGSAPHLRFNLHNCHKQSKHDNCFLSGNVVEYRINLIERIGLEKVEALECNYAYRKFDKIYCERIKKIFKEKTKRQKKRLGIN